MSSMIVLKRRIKSVKSTRQITKAMELISASKMRKASEATLASRYYAEVAQNILQHLKDSQNTRFHRLYRRDTIKARLHIVITSNRGLSGAYNKNVLQQFATHLKEDAEALVKSKAILIGRQAGRFASHIQGLEVLGLYDALPERAIVADMSPILATCVQQFSALEVDEVRVVYTRYVSNLVHAVDKAVLLPAGTAFESDDRASVQNGEITFEPDSNTVLDVATSRFLEVQLLQAYLESQASEQSARMLAMKTASDNAKDLIDDLVLVSNTVRQAAITQELAEITGGVGALV